MIKVECSLDSPDSDNKTVQNIVKWLSPNVEYVKRDYYWGPEAFNLQNSELFTNLSLLDQTLVLMYISNGLLEEAYFIEKAGIAFAAKMILLSETTQEREMYSKFAAQESNHLSMVAPFMRDTRYKESEFLKLLTDIIETGSKDELTYVIQVLLEGYGLSHYYQLRKSCIEPTLSHVFGLILEDEGLHYRSGVSLLDKSVLGKPFVRACVSDFLTHIEKGPTHVMRSVLEVTGDIHIRTYNKFLEDIRAYEQIEQAKTVFKRLLVSRD